MILFIEESGIKESVSIRSCAVSVVAIKNDAIKNIFLITSSLGFNNITSYDLIKKN